MRRTLPLVLQVLLCGTVLAYPQDCGLEYLEELVDSTPIIALGRVTKVEVQDYGVVLHFSVKEVLKGAVDDSVVFKVPLWGGLAPCTGPSRKKGKSLVAYSGRT